MPIHDWTRVTPGTFHDFHHAWIEQIKRTLNDGRMPADCFAMAEQRVDGPIADVLTLRRRTPSNRKRDDQQGGVALAEPLPKARIVERADEFVYADKANRIVIKLKQGDVIAVVEIMSPGNKSSASALRSFVDKAIEFIQRGVHLMVVDLFPPTKRDPFGIHAAIWDQIVDTRREPPDKPLTIVSYDCGSSKVAYVEPVDIGDALPEMPLILASDCYVQVPLETTYQQAWGVFPEALKEELQ